MRSLFKNAAVLWYKRGGDRLTAALSYYMIFSLAPLILLLLLIAGRLYDFATVGQNLLSWGTALFGPQLASFIADAVSNIDAFTFDSLTGAISSLILLGAVAVMADELICGLNITFGETARPTGAKGLFLHGFSIGLFIVLLGMFLLFTVLAVSFFALTTHTFTQIFGLQFGALKLFSPLFSIASLTIVLAAIYRVLPSAHPPWKSAFVGGFTASILFMLAQFAVRAYLNYTPIASLYGASGVLVTLLLWIYVMNAIIYYGAAVTRTHHIQ